MLNSLLRKQTVRIVLLCIAGFVLSFCPRAAAQSVTINPNAATYDYHPSAAKTPDGAIWAAWHAYSHGRDQILARIISADGTAHALHTLSDAGAAHGPPTLVVDNQGVVSVVWTALIDDRWRIALREFRGGAWSEVSWLSDLTNDAILPTAIYRRDGSLLVAWSGYRNGRFQIRARVVSGGISGAAFGVSTAGLHAYRPVLVEQGDHVWVFWDQYGSGNYSIRGRQVFPAMRDTQQISPEGENCLTPTAIANDAGIYVAWLRKIDVMGGPGVVSQWHTFHAAAWQDNTWKQIETPEGKTTAAELTHGLMAKIEPKAIATGGYLGPRLHPMWMQDGERVWLLWERKANHRGSTPTVSGELIGRPLRTADCVWEERVLLQQGRIAYSVVHPSEAADSRLLTLSSALPRRGLRTFATQDVDLELAQPFEQDAWVGWTPVDLPVKTEIPPRQEITVGDKRYKLFWADMHCHNGLTADAEGEPDEMHHYARDRANLDVVVFTNNDFYNVPLTQYEFQLGHLLATTFSSEASQAGREFLSLPGFEWTSRIPGTGTASIADSGNWLPPYQNRSYPNHRSVVYPPSGGPLVHFTEVGNDIAKLNSAVQAAGGVTLSQHSAFKLSGHPVEVGMELTSGWSNYIASRPQLFHEPLNKGARLGFTANGDTHRRAPGLSGALTGIYAEELTADAILDALRQRRCFATMGARIFVDSRASGALMGRDVTTVDGRVVLSVRAIGTRPIVSMTLIRDGREVHHVEGNGALELQATFEDDKLSSGSHWYYWRIRQERDAPVLPGNLMPAHGHLAWSSPHWVNAE